MMNYIYGELCKAVEKVTYEGLDSKTAAVVVDNEKNTIQVNIIDVPAELLNPNVDVLGPSGRYILLATLNLNAVTYKWVTIEDFMAKLESDKEAIYTRIDNEATRTDNMIQQVNDNVSLVVNQINKNMADGFNTINGGIQEEREKRASVDQHLWDILPDNIIAGTPMQGMEFPNAVNIVFSKYQKHGIGEDPANAEFVEMPNQTITLVSATQEVAGILTAGDKTKIDNIATDIETAVSAESTARQEADKVLQDNINLEVTDRQEADTHLGNRITAIEDTGVLNSQLTGKGKLAINVQSEAGRTFNIEAVDTSDAGNDDRFTLTLDNNDSISGKKLDGTSVPLVFMSKWDKVEVGGSSAPLNLNSNDGAVTVNDTYTLLNNKDRDNLNDAIEAEETRATQAEANLQEAIDAEITRAEAKETELDTAIQSEVTARSTADTQIHEELDAIDTRVGNLEGKTTRLFYGDGTAAEPTADGINTFVTTLPVDPPYAAPFEGIAVVVHRTDENTYHIWHYYSNTDKWQDDGVDTVSTFTNSIRGIIQGSTNDGYVAAENGLGKVSGWETVKSDIESLKTDKLNLSDIAKDYSGSSEQYPMTQKATNDAIANTLQEAQAAWEKDDETITSALESHETNHENPHEVTKAQVGLEFVDNTSDLDKPISTATQEALDAKAPTSHASLGTKYGVGDSTHYGHVKVDAIPTAQSFNAVSSQGVYGELANKVDKVEGKQLSTEDFTTAEKTKLSGIEENANYYILPDDVVQDASYVHTDNNYTTADKEKLAGIEEGAEKNLVTSVAGMTGAVSLSTITFTNESGTIGTYNGTQDITIDIEAAGSGDVGPTGPTGPYFTPSVSSEGVISWTNNGGLPNPSSVNIKGPTGNPGEDGAPGIAATIAINSVTTAGPGGTASVNNVGTSSAARFDFVIPQGPTGPAGPSISTHQANITFFDSATNASKTIKFYVVDETDSGDYSIGINDGEL